MPYSPADQTMLAAVKRNRATIVKKSNGQPPKSKERRQFQAWTVSQLLASYRDPREVLLSIASKETAELAKEMNASLQDAQVERAWRRWQCCPIAAKMPVSVDLRQTRTIALNILDERQYHEALEVAAEPADNDDGFNMTLIASPPVAETTEQARESPEPQHPGTVQDTAQAGGERPVRPAVAAASPQEPAGGWLRPASEWWDSVDGKQHAAHQRHAISSRRSRSMGTQSHRQRDLGARQAQVSSPHALWSPNALPKQRYNVDLTGVRTSWRGMQGMPHPRLEAHTTNAWPAPPVPLCGNSAPAPAPAARKQTYGNSLHATNAICDTGAGICAAIVPRASARVVACAAESAANFGPLLNTPPRYFFSAVSGAPDAPR